MIRIVSYTFLATWLFACYCMTAIMPAAAQSPQCAGVARGWQAAVASGSTSRISEATEAANRVRAACPELQKRVAEYQKELRREEARVRERELARQREADRQRELTLQRETDRKREVARIAAERERVLAKESAAKLRCNAQWQTAAQEGTLDGFDGFVRTCAEHVEAPTARNRAASIRANPLDIPGLPVAGTPIPREGLSADILHYANSCESGNADICSYLGHQFRIGKNVPQNQTWAAALFVRACASNKSNGCASLGHALAVGNGVRKDYARAIIFDQRGCEGGALFACYNWGIEYYNGDRVARNYETAVGLFERGCNAGKAGGHVDACKLAAEVYDEGLAPVVKNLAKALQLAEAGLRLEPNNESLNALKERLTPRSSTLPCNTGLYVVFFDREQFEIPEAAKAMLDRVYENYLACRPQQQPKLLIQITGHTDRLGSATRNLSLSNMRANGVKAYLTTKFDGRSLIASPRFLVAWRGEEQPAIPTADGVAETKNNRVEISFLPSN